MEFGSFIPRKGSERRPKPVDPRSMNDATVVDGDWRSMLQSHLNAQEPSNPSLPLPVSPPPNTPVGPSSPNGPRSTTSASNAETTVFPRIPRPEPGYQYPQQHSHATPYPATHPDGSYGDGPKQGPVSPSGRRSAPRAPQPQAAPAQLPQGDDRRSFREIEMVSHRMLRYYGDNRNTLLAVGDMVVRANANGVFFLDMYSNGRFTFIPWHRVHDLKTDANDPIWNY
jgi:hypothetical protein